MSCKDMKLIQPVQDIGKKKMLLQKILVPAVFRSLYFGLQSITVYASSLTDTDKVPHVQTLFFRPGKLIYI